VGSSTKTFVATTLLQLVGEGRLTLDEPVGRFVGDLLPPDLAGTVTLRMLLNHTSGISDIDHVMVTSYEDLEAVHRTTYTPKQLIDIALAQPRTNAPGAAHNYSNTGYIIAGVILERVTGRPAELEIARRITIPLGLWQTYLPGNFRYILGPHSEGYVPYPDSLRDFSVVNMSWLWTAGALISTADDLDKFYRALLSGKLLRPAQLTQMKTTFGDSGYGLGLYRVDLPCGVSLWGHDGAVFGYTTISWQTEDGATRIVHAENMYPVVDPAIAYARADFVLTALCGPADDARALHTPSLPLRDSLPLPRS
jgi:D-alanyl-D-alanine carboxypeptidase